MRRRRHALSIAAALVTAVAGVGFSAAAASAEPGLEYVQLGDSYSAGNGAGNYTGTTCWRSPENFGARIARERGADYTNVACGGGVVADILDPRELGDPTTRTATYEVPGGATDRQDGWLEQAKEDDLCGTPAQPDWFYAYTVTEQSADAGEVTGTVSCQLTAGPQIDAVSEQTDAVFLTIGGNDIGFSSIVIQCMVLRNAAGCERTIDAANDAIPQLKEQTKQALAAVHERSGGNADIYLLGYPFLFNTDSYEIPEEAPTYDVGAALHDLQVAGDRAQREGMAELDAAYEGGEFTFVDVKPAWDGHTHGLDPSTEADNSKAWLVPVLAPGTQRDEWVHPTDPGYAAMASALRAEMSSPGDQPEPTEPAPSRTTTEPTEPEPTDSATEPMGTTTAPEATGTTTTTAGAPPSPTGIASTDGDADGGAPERPDVVQTDSRSPGGGPSVTLAIGSLLAAAGVVSVLRGRTRRGAHRP